MFSAVVLSICILVFVVVCMFVTSGTCSAVTLPAMASMVGSGILIILAFLLALRCMIMWRLSVLSILEMFAMYGMLTTLLSLGLTRVALLLIVTPLYSMRLVLFSLLRFTDSVQDAVSALVLVNVWLESSSVLLVLWVTVLCSSWYALGTFTESMEICLLSLLPSVSVILSVVALKGPVMDRSLLWTTAPAPGLTWILAAEGMVPT